MVLDVQSDETKADSESQTKEDSNDKTAIKKCDSNVLLIGTELSMTEPPTGIALPSDQDSTEGDESEYDIGTIIYINKSNYYLDLYH